MLTVWSIGFEALLETLTVDAEAYLISEQTSNPASDVSFQWICLKKETEINATNFHYYTTSATDECFSSDHEHSAATTAPLFQTSVRHFRFRFLPQSYFLYVIVHVSNGSSTYVIVDVVMVTVVIGARPVVTISCIANCAEYLNPLLPFALTADCSNCEAVEALSYVWSVQPAAYNNTIVDFDWKANSVSGNKNRQIIVKVGAFLEVDKNEAYITTVIVIREDGSHGMAIRPLHIADAATLRLSMRAVNHKAPEDPDPTSDRSWMALYVCIGVASLSIVVVIGVAISYRKLASTCNRIIPFSSRPQREVKRTTAAAADSAIDPHRATAAVDVTVTGPGAAVAAPPAPAAQARPAAATTSSLMSSTSMTIQSDAESSQSRKSF